MPAEIIDGKKIAEEIRDEIGNSVRSLKLQHNITPGLATVLVGKDPASETYVRSKHRACERSGITSFGYQLPAGCSQDEIEDLVKKLNSDEQVHGILVQLPLPRKFDEARILSLVSPDKDVDGFNPSNIGALAMKGRNPLFVPCTPAGIMVLLQKTIGKLEGKQAVVIGRSNIVGMPVSLLLIRENATVTICHSKTVEMPSIIHQADIVVAAIGRAEFVRGDWIKPGAVVIDVGVNRVEDPFSPKGYRLVGDVAYDEALNIASAITPVPGGVGPMTIAMLLQNTLKSVKRTVKT